MGRVEIAGREIGAGRPAYIVAEMSANHLGSFDRAVRLVEVAKEVGADAVKLQTYTADTLTLDVERPEFRVGGDSPWSGKHLYELYREAATPWEWHPKLAEMARSVELDLFSTPFDDSAVELLESLDVPAYKIASPEIVDLPLIHRVAQTGKPVILSTGMASLGEIEAAVGEVRACGNEALVLLHCCSAYPAPPEEMNLRCIPQLRRIFKVPVGLSDHTLGTEVPVAAVALGAVVIEKHLMLSRSEEGPDSAFSLEPDEFRAMVEAVRVAERALGESRFGAGRREAESLGFRRSLYVVRDVPAGAQLTALDVRSIRPSAGLAPRHLSAVLGQRARRDLARGTPLRWAHLEPADKEHR